jgi:hypothetical protein
MVGKIEKAKNGRSFQHLSQTADAAVRCRIPTKATMFAARTSRPASPASPESPTRRNVPQDDASYQPRPPAYLGSRIPQQVEVSPVHVIEWNTKICRRRFLSSPEELRNEITIGKTDDIQRLFVFRGLPLEFVQTLKSSVEIDPAFIEAHAARRCYRPVRWRRDAQFVHYDFPELVTPRSGGLGDVRGYEPGEALDVVDMMRDIPIHSISDDIGADAAVFCRGSLWLTGQADGKQ